MLPVYRGTVRLFQHSTQPTPGNLAQPCPSRKTWGRQKLSPARNLFHPFCYTSKHQGSTPGTTAADSEGSCNVFHWRTNYCLGRNTVLGWTALQDSMGKAEEVWKARNQNITSLSSKLGSVRNLLFLQNCSMQCLDTRTTNGRPNNSVMISTVQVMYVIQHS